ncbi:hypothetical protein WA026_005549 [Henosepilachna vigintioctopunctata]|uniref:Uncharacterized protein n=1 Tax=Henosepilachna vigintioctopunctata TaxID=420089 RepID=A0AAW1TT48_9CUCU
MTIDFYYAPGSSPCRTVLLAAKALGLNPQHTIPTLVDNGLALSESRAIIGYLSNQYGKDDSLYPKDPKKRAVVDQRLYFDAATLYSRYADYYFPHYFAGVPLEPMKLDKLKEAFDILNTILGTSKYAAGDKLTLADLSLVASVSTADVSGFDISKYPHVEKWYANIKATAPGYEEANGKNLEAYKAMVDFLTKNK